MSAFDDQSLLPIGPRITESRTPDPTIHLRALQLYHQAWKVYRRAGCPYGETDEAMHIWYSLRDSERGTAFLTSKN